VNKTIRMGVCTVTVLIVTLLGDAIRAQAEPRYRRSVQTYAIPDVVLVNQDGAKVSLKTLMETDKPVVLDFIYGTCTTICPILSAGYANLQRKLGPDSEAVQLVSVSIDPENDTPRVMKEYLARYRAKTGWDFLTGPRADIDRVMRAFDAYVPDKMSHFQLTLIRVPRDGGWVRLSGLMSSAELMDEYTRAKQQ
jgi:protein SCO1/2